MVSVLPYKNCILKGFLRLKLTSTRLVFNSLKKRYLNFFTAHGIEIKSTQSKHDGIECKISKNSLRVFLHSLLRALDANRVIF